jgi:IS6 family transposase
LGLLTPRVPRVITGDKNAASPKAFKELQTAVFFQQRVNCARTSISITWLNKIIARIKRLTKPGMGFFSFETAWRPLQGFEGMNMIRKGQLQGGEKGDIVGQVALIATLFGVVA